MLKKRFLLITVYFLVSNTAIAADDKGQFAVRTQGMQSCANFVAAKKADNAQYAAFLGWMDGYFSAASQFTKHTYDIIPWGNSIYLATLLESYCNKNQKDLFYLAVNKLAGTFLKNRIQLQSELIEVIEGERKVYIYAVVLEKLKQHLKEKGLYDGNEDAVYDAQLKKAVTAYQKNNKLPVSQLPDPILLHHVFYK